MLGIPIAHLSLPTSLGHPHYYKWTTQYPMGHPNSILVHPNIILGRLMNLLGQPKYILGHLIEYHGLPTMGGWASHPLCRSPNDVLWCPNFMLGHLSQPIVYPKDKLRHPKANYWYPSDKLGSSIAQMGAPYFCLSITSSVKYQNIP